MKLSNAPMIAAPFSLEGRGAFVFYNAVLGGTIPKNIVF